MFRLFLSLVVCGLLPKSSLKIISPRYIYGMEKTGREFNEYVQRACQYAMWEYDLGIKTSIALFYLDSTMVDMLGACWISEVTIPDAANLIATTIQLDSEK